MINPFIKNIYSFLAYSVSWIVIFLIHLLLLVFFTDLSFRYSIIDSLIFNITFAVLGLSLWFPVKYISFESNSPFQIVVNHTAGAIIISLLWVTVSYLMMKYIYHPTKSEIDFLFSGLYLRFLVGILFYIILVSVNYLILYYHIYKEKLKNEAKLQNLIKEAELKTLKYQINPHFIFNSLNSISALTISNPPKAQEMTIKLSSFIRATLSKTEKQLVRLIDEINNIKLYLDIEKIRFENKFDYIESIDDNCKEILIPNMILQPIFENAIKHGVYESLEKVIIKINAKIDKEYLALEIENNFDPDSIPNKGEGIGLKNITERLKLIYNQENLLTLKKQNGIFLVIFYIPIR